MTARRNAALALLAGGVLALLFTLLRGRAGRGLDDRRRRAAPRTR